MALLLKRGFTGDLGLNSVIVSMLRCENRGGRCKIGIDEVYHRRGGRCRPDSLVCPKVGGPCERGSTFEMIQ